MESIRIPFWAMQLTVPVMFYVHYYIKNCFLRLFSYLDEFIRILNVNFNAVEHLLAKSSVFVSCLRKVGIHACTTLQGKPVIRLVGTFCLIFIVVPCCMLFQSLFYCSNSCTSLHFKALKSHTKTLKIRPYMFRSPLKPSSGGPWPYFARLQN